MTKKNGTSLEKLQEDAKNGKYDDDLSIYIFAFKLHLLLSADITTRKLILDIVKDAQSTDRKNAGTAVQERTDAVADEAGTTQNDVLAKDQDEIKRLSQNLTQEQTKRQEQETQLADANNENAQLRQNLTQEQTQRKEQEDQLADANNENAQLRQKLTQEQTKRQEQETQLAVANNENTQLRQNLTQEQTQRKEQEDQLADANNENAQLRQKLTQEQTQRKGLQDQLAVANKELQQLQKERNELERKLNAVPPPDTLREQLKPEMALLEAVKADAELAQVWLHSGEVSNENEARQLVRLVSVMGDWDQLQRLWSRLADRCKKDKRPITKIEEAVLKTALDFHNLRYRDHAAELVYVPVGSDFHLETMERGTPQGSTVRAVWLPGLKNAAGKLQKQALVQTSA